MFIVSFIPREEAGPGQSRSNGLELVVMICRKNDLIFNVAIGHFSVFGL